MQEATDNTAIAGIAAATAESPDASTEDDGPRVLAERRASLQAWVQYARALFSAAEFRFID